MKSQCLHHDKFRDLHKLIESQSTAHTAGYLELIWAHAAQAKHGPILKRERIEKIADWIGEPGVLLAAMLEVRFLDAFDGDCVIIHDWKDHCPEYVKRRDYMKDYMKDKREKEKLADVNANLTLTGVKLTTVNPPTYTNLTNTNHTESTDVLSSDSSKKPKQQKLPGTQRMPFKDRAAACGYWDFHRLYPEHRHIDPHRVLPLWEAAIKEEPEITRKTIMEYVAAMIDNGEYTKENGLYCPGMVKFFNEKKWLSKPVRTGKLEIKENHDPDDDKPFGKKIIC